MDRSQDQLPLVPTGTRVGWRLPALAVVVLLVALVALTRLGGAAGPQLAPPSHVGPTLAAEATAARIVLATVEPDPRCTIRGATTCLPRLHVLQQIWSGSAVALVRRAGTT